MGDDSGWSKGPRAITRTTQKSGREQEVTEARRCHDTAGCRPQATRHELLPEAGKGKELGSLKESLASAQRCEHLAIRARTPVASQRDEEVPVPLARKAEQVCHLLGTHLPFTLGWRWTWPCPLLIYQEAELGCSVPTSASNAKSCPLCDLNPMPCEPNFSGEAKA